MNWEMIFFKNNNKYFRPTKESYKIFNKNTVKLSFRCLLNMVSNIKLINIVKLIFKKIKESKNYICNCD